jgi:DNA-binding response OmpR family regulator
MSDDPSANYGDLVSAGNGDDAWNVESRDRRTDQLVLRPPRSYRQVYGGDPVRVGLVEFRIMALLASRPYHAFTPRQIAAAASTTAVPVAEADVEGRVDSLRDQLGVFHDFVQVVPGVGYRFKA